MKKYLKNKKGFTLIELIVVIAILGILAALVIPKLSGFTDTAKISADEAFQDTVENTVKTLITAGAITGDGDIIYTDSTKAWTGDVTVPTAKYASIDAMMDAMIDNADLQYYGVLTIDVDVSEYSASGALTGSAS